MAMEIIHLKQLHKYHGIPEYDDQKEHCNSVVKVQLELAYYLANNNNIPVVLESLYNDINCENSSDICTTIQQYVFPNGLPESFEQLTYLQKAILYEDGAAITLTYMGILSKTYKSIDKNNFDKIKDDVSKNIYKDLHYTREKLAIENAKLAAQEYYNSSATQRKVFIVFGAEHDFNDVCNEFGYTLSKIDASKTLAEIALDKISTNYIPPNQINEDQIDLEIVADIDGDVVFPTLTQSNDICSTSLITKSSENGTLSEKLKMLSEAYPCTANKLIQSQYLDIKELSNFAENHFEILKEMTRNDNLIDFIAAGTLPLEQSLEVFDYKEHEQHLWGIVKDSLLDKSISFEQFLDMSYDEMDAMHSFKTTEELASYVTNIVGDMDQATCLWSQSSWSLISYHFHYMAKHISVQKL